MISPTLILDAEDIIHFAVRDHDAFGFPCSKFRQPAKAILPSIDDDSLSKAEGLQVCEDCRDAMESFSVLATFIANEAHL